MLARFVPMLCACVCLFASACHRDTPPAATPAPSAADGSAQAAGEPPTRIIAVGDLHGDLASARDALALADLIDADGSWIGGDAVLVQLGDQTDRGDDEREILEWLDELAEQASDAGGAVHVLLGNHEVMNVQLDLRYVTPGGFDDWSSTPFDTDDPLYSRVPPEQRGRVAAFRPGGPWAVRLSEHPVALQLGETVFVHGGLTEQHATLGIEAINAGVAAWMQGEAPLPESMRGENSPIWYRGYSLDTDAEDCAGLERTLTALDAQRMVVGHTVQEGGITSACDERVWRVDVGLSDHYGGPTQVLEIVGDRVTIVR